jgi:hypothetical protein
VHKSFAFDPICLPTQSLEGECVKIGSQMGVILRLPRGKEFTSNTLVDHAASEVTREGDKQALPEDYSWFT